MNGFHFNPNDELHYLKKFRGLLLAKRRMKLFSLFLTGAINAAQGCFIIKPSLIIWQYGVFCFDKETEYFASSNGFLIKTLKWLKRLSRRIFVSRNNHSFFDSYKHAKMLCVVGKSSLKRNNYILTQNMQFRKLSIDGAVLLI